MPYNVTIRTATNTATQSTLRKPQVDEKVYRAFYEMHPFVVLLRLIRMGRAASTMGNKMSGVKNVGGPEFSWIEKDNGQPITTAAAQVNAGGNTLTVPTNVGLMFTAGDLIKIPTTGEIVLVVSVTGDALTIVKAWGQDASLDQIIPAGAMVTLFGNVREEGADARAAISFGAEKIINYTQIFSQTVEQTKTQEATEYYGDVESIETKRQDAFEKFLRERSMTYIAGCAKEDLTGTHPKRATSGLLNLINTNIVDFSGAFSYAKWLEYTRVAFFYDPRPKLQLLNSKLMNLIQLEVLEKCDIVASPLTDKYGINIQRFKTSYGEIDFMYERNLDYLLDPTKGHGITVDLDSIEEMVLRPDVWRESIQEKKSDKRMDEVIGECGLKLVNEPRHSRLIV